MADFSKFPIGKPIGKTTIADFGPMESEAYASHQKTLEELQAIGKASDIRAHVEPLDVTIKQSEYASNMFLKVPTAKPFAHVKPPPNYGGQFRALYTSSVIISMGIMYQMKKKKSELDTLDLSHISSRKQKGVFSNLYEMLIEMDGWLAWIRTSMARFAKG